MARSIICGSQRLRQIIDFPDTDKSQYFAITEFNKCFIIWSPYFFFNEYLPFSCKRDSKKEKSVVSFTNEQNIICSQTKLNNTAHEQTIICGHLLAGHMGGSWPMKEKKNLHWMIICITCCLRSWKKAKLGNVVVRQWWHRNVTKKWVAWISDDYFELFPPLSIVWINWPLVSSSDITTLKPGSDFDCLIIQSFA